MSRLEDRAYYELRAVEEIDQADQAADAIVAAVHYELANRYSTLVGPPGTHPAHSRRPSASESRRSA